LISEAKPPQARRAGLRVSLIVACRNEAGFIANCLDSILANDFPQEQLEILVVDGLSHDGTRGIVAAYAGRFPFLRMIDNPRGITPCAFNLGLRHAAGDYIMIMGAHSTYSPTYISQCIAYVERYHADNVGGVIRATPRNAGPVAKAIIAALSHPFGVGGAQFRTAKGEPRWVDTVFGGCYRRDVFDRVGSFNENLTYSQDLEFNLRLKSMGGRTLLVPDIVSEYSARSDLRSFVRHNFRNGAWVILPFAYSTVIPVRARHLVPLVFLLAVMGTLLLTLFVPAAWSLAAIVLGAYAAGAMAASVSVAWRERSPAMLLLLPVSFAALHFAYGFGSLLALGRMLGSIAFWRKLGASRTSVASAR
jgi:glycosyltransferase involved in cell wall biosynthesis